MSHSVGQVLSGQQQLTPMPRCTTHTAQSRMPSHRLTVRLKTPRPSPCRPTLQQTPPPKHPGPSFHDAASIPSSAPRTPDSRLDTADSYAGLTLVLSLSPCTCLSMLTGGTRSLFCAHHVLRILPASRTHPLWKCAVTARYRSISSLPKLSRHASHKHMTPVPPMREHQVCSHELAPGCNNPAPPVRERQLHYNPHASQVQDTSPVHAEACATSPSAQEQPACTARAGTPGAPLLPDHQQQAGAIHPGKLTPVRLIARDTSPSPSPQRTCFPCRASHSPGLVAQSDSLCSRGILAQPAQTTFSRSYPPRNKRSTSTPTLTAMTSPPCSTKTRSCQVLLSSPSQKPPQAKTHGDLLLLSYVASCVALQLSTHPRPRSVQSTSTTKSPRNVTRRLRSCCVRVSTRSTTPSTSSVVTST